jgi:hypothetical protein
LYSEYRNQSDALYVVTYSSKRVSGLTFRERRLAYGWLRRNGAQHVPSKDSYAWWRVSLYCPDFVREAQSNGDFNIVTYLYKVSLSIPSGVPLDILNGKGKRNW